MSILKPLWKQVVILFVLSVLIAVASIIHGIFFDLDFEQIQRLTLMGFIFTLIVIFPALILIEWIFDMNNRKEYEEINRRLNKLERKK